MAAILCDTIGQARANPCNKDDQIQQLGLNGLKMDRFGSILRKMNLGAIPLLASKIRQFSQPETGIVSSKPFCDSRSISCRVVGTPLCGSFNIIFTLEFGDGVKWMLKIPANGHCFDPVAAAALISEARTMQLLKKETTIPIPEVFAFDASSCNVLNSPFILMECIDGQPLYRGWYNDEIPKARLEHFRVKALQSLAEAMAQLNKFTLKRGGALEFDSTGNPLGIRGAKIVDAVAMYDPDPDDDEEDNICEKGPFESPKSAFLFDLDRSIACHKDNEYTLGCYKALCMFIDLAFPNSDYHDRGFVLAHPDLDIQNVLMAEDGTLRGLIDWDGVASVPRQIGCAQYPLWLMRDWLPFHYVYDIREGKTEEDADYEESSPAELASYRALYAHLMEKEIERQTGGSDLVTAFGTLPSQEAQLTRRSLVMRDLDLAARDPFLTTNILCHIMNQIEEVTEPDWGDMDLDMDSESSCSSERAGDSDSDTNSDVNSGSDKGDPGIEATETNSDSSRRTITATSIHRPDGGVAMSERVGPQSRVNDPDRSLKVPQSEYACQTIADAGQTADMEQGIEQSSNTDVKEIFPFKSTRAGWGRRLLCDVAEKGLRRIAKIGHVLEDTSDKVAEVVADVEIQHHKTNFEHPAGGELAHTTISLDHQQIGRTKASRFKRKEQPEYIPATQDMVETEHHQDIPQVYVLAELQGNTSTRDTERLDQADGIASVQPVMKLDDVPAKKAELIKAEKEKKRAQYRADKAKTKEESKVWEQISLAVGCRGVSLEQLRMNQSKIARLVVDTLQADKEQEDEPVADIDHPSAAQSAKQGTEQPEQESKVFRSLEDLPKLANVEGGVPSGACEVNIANTTEPQHLKSKFSKACLTNSIVTKPDDLVLIYGDRQDEPESFNANLSKSQPEYGLARTRSSHHSKRKGAGKEKDRLVAAKASLTPPKSMTGSKNGDSDNSDPEKSRKSSVTSLSNDDANLSEGLEAIEDGDGLFGTVVIPTAANWDAVRDKNDDNDGWKGSGTSAIMKEKRSQNDPALVGNYGLPNKVSESGRDGWIVLDETDSSAETDSITGGYVDEGIADTGPAKDCKEGFNANADNQGEDNENGHSSSDKENRDQGTPAFEDDGEFRSRNVFTLLGMDKLDELRLLRMQEGFLKLLEQY